MRDSFRERMERQENIVDSMSSIGALRIAGDLKRKRKRPDEVRLGFKREKLDGTSSCSVGPKNDFLTNFPVTSDGRKEFIRPTKKPPARIQENYSGNRKNKIDVSLNQNSSVNHELVFKVNDENEIKNEVNSESSASEEDSVNNCSEEFLRLLLMDIEKEKNDNTQKTAEFLPLIHERTPQKTHGRDFHPVNNNKLVRNENSLINLKKKRNAVNEISDSILKAAVDQEIPKVLVPLNGNDTTFSTVKKTEPSRRKLNFQDLIHGTGDSFKSIPPYDKENNNPNDFIFKVNDENEIKNEVNSESSASEEDSVKNEVNSESSASEEDSVNNCSEEFLRLLLMDIEKEKNDNTQKTAEFLPLIHERTPQKTHGRDFHPVNNNKLVRNENSLINLKKKRNAFDEIGDSILKAAVDQEIPKVLVPLHGNDTTFSTVKKTEPSRRKLNFQDLIHGTGDSFKSIPPYDKENNNPNDFIFYDVDKSQRERESYLEGNEKLKKDESIFQYDHGVNNNRKGGRGDIKSKEMFPLLSSRPQRKAAEVKLSQEKNKLCRAESDVQKRGSQLGEEEIFIFETTDAEKTNNSVGNFEKKVESFQHKLNPINLKVTDERPEDLFRNLSGARKANKSLHDCFNLPMGSSNEEKSDSESTFCDDVKDESALQIKNPESIVEEDESIFEYDNHNAEKNRTPEYKPMNYQDKENESIFKYSDHNMEIDRKNNESKSIKLSDLLCLKDKSGKADESIFERAEEESIFQQERPDYTDETKNYKEIASRKRTQSKGHFLSQSHCKTDQMGLGEKRNQVCDVKSNKSCTLSWIEEKIRFLQNSSASPIKEKIWKNAERSFSTIKGEEKPKSCDEQEAICIESKSVPQALMFTKKFHTENSFAPSQKDSNNKERAPIVLDCPVLMTPPETKKESSNAALIFCEPQQERNFISQSESENIKSKDFLHPEESSDQSQCKNKAADCFSQPQSKVDQSKIQGKNIQIISDIEEERFPQSCFSQLLTRTNREKSAKESFEDFILQSCSQVKRQREQVKCLMENDGRTSEDQELELVSAENIVINDVLQINNFLVSNDQNEETNFESSYFVDNADIESSGRNFAKVLKDIDRAFDKMKVNLNTEPVEKRKEKTTSNFASRECNNSDDSPRKRNARSPREIQEEGGFNSRNSDRITFQELHVRKMKDNGHYYSTLQNKASLFVAASEFEDFARRHLDILDNQILDRVELSQKSQFSSGNFENFEPDREGGESGFTRTFISRALSNGALSTGSEENFSPPKKRLRQGLNRVIKDKSLLHHQEDVTASASSQTVRLRVIEKISKVFVRLLDDVVQKRSPILEVRNQKDWGNCEFINNRVTMRPFGETTTIIINHRRKTSSTKFNLIVFLLGRIVNMMSENSTCTKRELYYQLIKFVKSESQLNGVVDCISCLLDEPPWELGIIAMSKGLIYGDLKIVSSDETIHCNVSGGSLVPQDVQKITQLMSDAYFILIVEKDAIFQKLLKEDLPNKLTRPFIMITGKGYPDLNLRFFIKKLVTAMSVPIFILVDADPFGIDIMLTYRFGSLTMSHLSEYLAVPNARWIGVHPSEIIDLNISRQPLAKKDLDKIRDILKRPYCQSFPKLKDELEVLLENNFKAEIEGVLKSDTFLRDFYLPNKFLTGDYI